MQKMNDNRMNNIHVKRQKRFKQLNYECTFEQCIRLTVCKNEKC